MENSKNQQKIIFSEKTSEIISTILRRYKLEESPEEIVEKFYKGEASQGEIILEIVMGLAEEKNQIKDLPSFLSKKLSVSAETAKQLAGDIKKDLLDLVQKVPEKVSLPPTRESLEKKPSPEKEDVYREPIE